jgi:hypothetical protein
MRSAAEVESAVARLKSKIPTPLWQQLREAGFVLPEAPTP